MADSTPRTLDASQPAPIPDAGAGWSTPFRVVISAVFWLYLAISLMAFWFAIVIPWLISVPLDPRRRFSHWYAYTWACHYLAVFPFWRIRIEGHERIDDGRAQVIACNHQSMGDIFVLFKLRKQYKWVAKREVFSVPFLGWMMWMADYVPIRRGDPKSRERMMAACLRQLRQGNSIMIFPEGTRSTRPEMRPFKLGAFYLACDAKVPLIPVVLEGTRHALPRRTWVFQQRGVLDIDVRVLEPIDPASCDFDPRRLAKLARERMEKALEDLRADRLATGRADPSDRVAVAARD